MFFFYLSGGADDAIGGAQLLLADPLGVLRLCQLRPEVADATVHQPVACTSAGSIRQGGPDMLLAAAATNPPGHRDRSGLLGCMLALDLGPPACPGVWLVLPGAAWRYIPGIPGDGSGCIDKLGARVGWIPSRLHM